MAKLHKKYRDRLNKLADFLQKLPPRKFNIENWVDKTDAAGECGTVCCALGWAPAAFPKQWKWVPDTFLGALVPAIRGGDMMGDATEFFGLPFWGEWGPDYSGTLRHAFMPSQYPPGIRVTPKMVAKRLRELALTEV